MNIAIFTDTFLPKFDGIVTSIINTTLELTRRGHKVKIFAPRIRKNQREIIQEHNPLLDVELIPGVKAMFYPGFRITFPATPWIVPALRRMNTDIIHFHTPFTLGMEAIIGSACLKTPLISTFHTYFTEPEYLKIVHLHKVPGLSKFGWAYSNFFHNLCDVTISPSQFTADELKRKWLKCPVRIVSNGIQLQKPKNITPQEKEAIKKKYNLKNHVMLFVGRISVEKSVDVLIRAAHQVFQNREDTSLLIIGDGPALEDVKAAANRLGVSDNVVFTGAIPHKELIESGVFEISRFFVTASTSENQPMTIIESCMFGLPLIGVDAKGIPEMISHNGFLAKPGDDKEIAGFMMKLLEDNELRNKMSKAAILQGSQYDIKKTTDKMEEIYKTVQNKVKRQKQRKLSLRMIKKIFFGKKPKR